MYKTILIILFVINCTTIALECSIKERETSCINNVREYRNCTDIGKPIRCMKLDPKDCIKGCICIDNYLRANNGTCIKRKECPEPISSSSASASASSSAQSSSTSDSASASAYAYSSAYSDIHTCKNPPSQIVCGPDEQYSGCVNGGCGRRNCSQPGIICIDLIEGACKEGCLCKDNYLRADNGSCIPEKQCPLICYGQNEIPECEVICPPQTCESIGMLYNCPFIPANPPCKPVCRCKSGYYRNKIGDCISKSDCLKCTGPHEYFSCGPECDNECFNLSKQNQTNCPFINIMCNEKCYCENGYARNYRKICVPYSKCPPETFHPKRKKKYI